ncbi:hypothetical protein ILYODFUR_028597 [Ilyodon furcidens]|uniref:Uncharacterized protein n=1 Tax=Ilyodon furcidens TaxID=33524 RepID=A0ABV0T3N3_9TELE
MLFILEECNKRIYIMFLCDLCELKKHVSIMQMSSVCFYLVLRTCDKMKTATLYNSTDNSEHTTSPTLTHTYAMFTLSQKSEVGSESDATIVHYLQVRKAVRFAHFCGSI